MSDTAYIRPETLAKKLTPQLEETFGNFLVVVLIPNRKGLLCPFAWYNVPTHHRKALWNALVAEIGREVPEALPDSIPLELRSEMPPAVQEGLSKTYPLIHKHCKLFMVVSYNFPEPMPTAEIPPVLPPGTKIEYMVSGHCVNVKKALQWYSRKLQDGEERNLKSYGAEEDHGTDTVPKS